MGSTRRGWVTRTDYHSHWLTIVPSVQAATHDFLGATIYAEAGGHIFRDWREGRTNLNPYWNLGFDPNDYVQFGAGYRDESGNTISAYAIHDDRLDTGQTNTHLTIRRYLPHEWRLTLDTVYEQGRGERWHRVEELGGERRRRSGGDGSCEWPRIPTSITHRIISCASREGCASSGALQTDHLEGSIAPLSQLQSAETR